MLNGFCNKKQGFVAAQNATQLSQKEHLGRKKIC